MVLFHALPAIVASFVIKAKTDSAKAAAVAKMLEYLSQHFQKIHACEGQLTRLPKLRK